MRTLERAVMLSLASVEERIVGVLHDLVEDTRITLDDRVARYRAAIESIRAL